MLINDRAHCIMGCRGNLVYRCRKNQIGNSHQLFPFFSCSFVFTCQICSYNKTSMKKDQWEKSMRSWLAGAIIILERNFFFFFTLVIRINIFVIYFVYTLGFSNGDIYEKVENREK